MLKIKEVAS